MASEDACAPVSKGVVYEAHSFVGDSSDSTNPHLRFHISDANSPLGSEGLPYVFASFEVQDKGGGWKAAVKDVVEKREMEIPMQNAVIRFPGER